MRNLSNAPCMDAVLMWITKLHTFKSSFLVFFILLLCLPLVNKADQTAAVGVILTTSTTITSKCVQSSCAVAGHPRMVITLYIRRFLPLSFTSYCCWDVLVSSCNLSVNTIWCLHRKATDSSSIEGRRRRTGVFS